MKDTIEQIELQAARELTTPLKNFLRNHYPLPSASRLTVSLVDENGRKKRRSASFDNWSPDTGEIRIRLEPARTGARATDSEPASDSSPFHTASATDFEATALADMIRSLDRAEKRPGFPFVSLKWFRDQDLPAEGLDWTSSDETRQNVLRIAIEKRLILTSKVPNPKSPQFPVTAIRLNRLMPEVAQVLGEKGEDSDFHPVEIRGEPLSATILRERRR